MLRSGANNGGGGGAVRGQRLSPFDDDESGDESYDASRSSSAGSSSMQIPAPASVPRPPRIKMVGTVLPQDSMRGNKTCVGGKPFASNTKKPTVSNAKLFAAAGLDLFRQGLAFDGLQSCHLAPRHPAVTPNLNPIQEDEENPVFAEGVSTESQVIVVLGAEPLKRRGEVSACAASRIEKASQLYWEVTKVYAEQQANSHCYLVPMAEESGKDGVLECEAIRNALATAGISPHHILMDCSAPLAHLWLNRYVSAERDRQYGAARPAAAPPAHPDRPRGDVTVPPPARANLRQRHPERRRRHEVPSVVPRCARRLRATERARREKLEHVIALRSQQALEDAITRVQRPQREVSNHSNGNGGSGWGVNSTRGASRIASQSNSAPGSNGFSNNGSYTHRGV